MARLKRKTPQVAQDRKDQSTAHLKGKVAVLESFVAAGGVPEGYAWPGWEFENKEKRLAEKKVLVLTGSEAFRCWHDPKREFKVKGDIVHGVHRIGSPGTLSANDENKRLVATAISHIKTLQKLAKVKASDLVKELTLQLKSKQELLNDLANQVAVGGLENKKLKEKVSRLKADIDQRDRDLVAARDLIRSLKKTTQLKMVKGRKDGDDE